MNSNGGTGTIIIDGFKEDADSLINEFLQDSIYLHVKDFLQLWKDNKFDLIYASRTILTELLEFIDEVFLLVGEMLFSSKNEYKNMVAVLYLIYCLWHSRPNLANPSIKVLPSQANILLNLKNEAKLKQNCDVHYVLCSLLVDGVFKFVLASREYGLEPYFRKYNQDIEHMKISTEQEPRDNQNTTFKELSNKVGLKEINLLADDYKNLKSLINANKKDDSLFMAKLDCLKDIEQFFESDQHQEESYTSKKEAILYKQRCKKNLMTANEDPSEPGPSKLQKKDNKNVFFDYGSSDDD